jgi:hypothetical protein
MKNIFDLTEKKISLIFGKWFLFYISINHFRVLASHFQINKPGCGFALTWLGLPKT